MSSVEALQRADLEGALAALQDEVRAEPGEACHRVFLFQLLSVLGQWDRALRQLDVARQLDPETVLMAQTYREVLSCEVLRQEVFGGEKRPLILGEPEPWVAKVVDALRRSSQGEYAAARELTEEAWEEAPPTSGNLLMGSPDESSSPKDSGGVDFEWIADSDTRLGPILEVIVDGKYYWAPFHRIGQIKIEPPSDLRDFVWTPAQFTWSNQGQAIGMIPTRYPGSEAHEDAEIRLARKSLWSEPAEGVFEGMGQRVLATDAGDFALLDVRTVTLNPHDVR